VQVDTRNTSQWDLSLTGFRPEDILLVSGTDRADLDKVSDVYECRLCLFLLLSGTDRADLHKVSDEYECRLCPGPQPQLERSNNTFF
jgi:hypothetical protein